MDPIADDLIDVLFVEGDPNVAELYRHRLHLDGYRVTVAKPVGDWLDLAGRAWPDIVYIEVSTADAESIASFKTLRDDDRLRNVPTIILTSAREPEFRERGIVLGTIDYLVRPPATAMSLWSVADDVFAAHSVASASAPLADVDARVGSRTG
jgi:DNA-binding response OmpR family regulator